MSEYYSPNIDELHIGYEGFLLGQKVVIETVYDFEHWKSNPIVTKYLSKEQIEAEGWKFVKEKKINEREENVWVPTSTQYFNKITSYGDWGSVEFEMTYIPSTNKIEIGFDAGEFALQHIFIGEIPSINEFKTLMKWLKIK